MAAQSLDEKDWGIMIQLRGNPSLTDEEIGTAIGLSSTAVLRRRLKLETNGVMIPRIEIAGAVLGLPKTIYVLLKLQSLGGGATGAFEQALATLFPNCVEWASVTGEYDYLMRFLVENEAQYEGIHVALVALPNIKDVYTLHTLGRVIDRHAPLPPDALRALRRFGGNNGKLP